MHYGAIFSPAFRFGLYVDDFATDLLAVAVGDGEVVVGGSMGLLCNRECQIEYGIPDLAGVPGRRTLSFAHPGA
jgi:hypothetical protein